MFNKVLETRLSKYSYLQVSSYSHSAPFVCVGCHCFVSTHVCTSTYPGKAAKDEYILDYGYPLTPLQALALGLSSLALKLANEGG